MTATKDTKHGTIIVDDCDADLLVKCVVTETHAGYPYARAYSYSKGVRTDAYIHRLVMARVVGRPLLRSENIDHINKQTLDCRRSNMRIATPSQNHGNTKLNSNNTSGFKGVIRHKATNRWAARIVVNRRAIHLGYHDTPADAHAAYMAAAREYFGEFANSGKGE